MNDTDKIEVAAKAIHITFANRSGRAREWDDTPEIIKASFREEARAALKALGIVNR